MVSQHLPTTGNSRSYFLCHNRMTVFKKEMHVHSAIVLAWILLYPCYCANIQGTPLEADSLFARSQFTSAIDVGGGLLPDPTQDLLKALNLSPGYGLNVITSRFTVAGKRKVKCRQTFNEVEIYGTGITGEYFANGTFTGNWTGHVSYQPISAPVSPLIVPLDATRVLAHAFGFCPSDVSYFRTINQKLVLYSKYNTDPLTLAYFTSFVFDGFGIKEVSAPHGFVKADDRMLLEYWNGLEFQSPATIKGVGGNVGTTGLVTYNSLKVLRLSSTTCQYNTPNAQVQSIRYGGSSQFSPTQFPCDQAMNSSYDSINGGYSPLNDVAWNSEIVVNMYQTYLGVQSPTGSLPLKARVHYGINYENAFWDGAYFNVGDGSNIFYPLTSLDIVGHEYGHGFSGLYSQLQLSGESGGINEAFSDMSGQASVYFASGNNSFVVGQAATKSNGGVRFMCNPPADGKSIENATQFTAGMDVHYSSGVYNKAMCILSQTPGWDTSKAFMVMAYASSVYWTQTTSFRSGVCGLMMATVDTGMNPNDVAAAFKRVGLSC